MSTYERLSKWAVETVEHFMTQMVGTAVLPSPSPGQAVRLLLQRLVGKWDCRLYVELERHDTGDPAPTQEDLRGIWERGLKGSRRYGHAYQQDDVWRISYAGRIANNLSLAVNLDSCKVRPVTEPVAKDE